MKIYGDIGVGVPQVYLPRTGVDLTKWAVIACDQFTSQPEYWRQVEAIVGSAPSTLNLVLPEVYLEKPGEDERIRHIHASMQSYLNSGILEPQEGLIYVERRAGEKTRKGIVLCLDLDRYDYSKGSTSLIRATEGTIIERIPPRMRIRQGAPLELPHILVLIDDPQGTVIEPLCEARSRLAPLYDFDLMLGSGHLTGYRVDDPALEANVIQALRGLARPETFAAKYGLSGEQPVLLFAMGDGNHSLATAKATWEKLKTQPGIDPQNHPARYALVEIENVHDEGLEFEPIHRVLFDLRQDVFQAMQSRFGGNYTYHPLAGQAEMVAAVDKAAGGPRQAIGAVSPWGYGLIEIANPSSNLSVGTLQAFLDIFMKESGAGKIDYVHGQDVVTSLGAQPGNAGFYVPGMSKSDLFKTVILDGVLPRKTFSMGEAHEKRFYMECRKIA